MIDSLKKFINQQEAPSSFFILMPRFYGALTLYFFLCQLAIIRTQFGEFPCSAQLALNGEITGFGFFSNINNLYLGSLNLAYFSLACGLLFSIFFILLGYSHVLALLTYILVCSHLVTPCLALTMGDHLFGAVCFLMIFYPSDHIEKVSIWFRRSFLLFLCFIYSSSVYGRLSHSTWKEGVEVWYALADPTASRLSAYLIDKPDALPAMLIALVTWASFTYEAFFPLILFSKKFRKWLIISGITFHIGLALFIRLEIFTPVMLFLLLNCIQGRKITEDD